MCQNCEQTDEEYFYHHIMRAYESTQAGLINLLKEKHITEKEFSDMSIKNFQNYKKCSEEFAKRIYGRSWRKNLQELKSKFRE